MHGRQVVRILRVLLACLVLSTVAGHGKVSTNAADIVLALAGPAAELTAHGALETDSARPEHSLPSAVRHSTASRLRSSETVNGWLARWVNQYRGPDSTGLYLRCCVLLR